MSRCDQCTINYVITIKTISNGLLAITLKYMNTIYLLLSRPILPLPSIFASFIIGATEYLNRANLSLGFNLSMNSAVKASDLHVVTRLGTL